MQYPYDPGTLPGSANQRILGKVYLRSNLSRKLTQSFSAGQGVNVDDDTEVRNTLLPGL